MKIKLCNEQVNDPFPQVCGKPASNKIQQYGYSFYVCDEHKSLYPLKKINVLDPESLAEYRLCIMKKHKDMYPHLYTHKPIEEYVKNRFAFMQAFIASELKEWKDYSVPDLWDIFKVFDLEGNLFNEIVNIIWREAHKMDKLERKERKNKPLKISETFYPSLRWQILERDGHKCVKCGRTVADGVKLHVDHIYPKSRGGMATLENGQTLCNECNIGKGARIPETHTTLHIN